MKAVLIAAMLFTSPALAFDKDATVWKIYDAEFACLQGQNHDGEQLNKAMIKIACNDLARLRGEMKTQGYCYDKAKLEWSECK